MKKLLLTAMGCALALTSYGQADNLYIAGSGGPGLSWTPTNAVAIPYQNGKYTYTFDENATPSFKISTVKADWDSGFNSNCLGLSTGNADVASTNLNKDLKLTSGWSGNIQLPIASTYTITITYNSGSYYINIGTPGGVAPDYVAPSKVYLKGDDNSWEGSEDYALSLQSSSPDASGNYVFSGNIASLSGTFKVCQTLGSSWDGINYGVGDYGTTTVINTNTKVECTNNGGNISCGNNTYTNCTVTFTYNQTGTSYIEINTNGVAVTYPETLYIFGDVGSIAFNPQQGIQCSQADQTNGVYTFSNITVQNNNNGNGWFSFLSQLGTQDGEEGWAEIKPYRYGSIADNTVVTAGGSPVTLQSGENSFQIVAGTYNFVADLKNGTLTATTGTTPSPDTYPAAMYIVGSNVNGNGWGQFTKCATAKDGVYTWTDMTIGNSFKFTDSEGYTGEIGSKDNQQVILGTPYTYAEGGGNISFADDVISVSAATVTLDMTAGTLTITGTPTYQEGPAILYVRASWNDYGTDDEMEYSDTEENVYTWSGDVALPEDGSWVKFKIADADWATYEFGGQGESPSIEVFSNQPGTATLVNNGSDLSISNWEGGKMVITFNLSTKALTVEGPEQETTGINTIENVLNGEEVIYNLQGIRVNRDNMKAGIYVINGKKVMVK